MSTIQNEQIILDQIDSPAEFYAASGKELDNVGGDAFGQPAETFGVQVAERFNEAGLAHIFRVGDRIIGFALYSLIPLGGRHLWPVYTI